MQYDEYSEVKCVSTESDNKALKTVQDSPPADPVRLGAGNSVGTIMTRNNTGDEVSDRIELYIDIEATRACVGNPKFLDEASVIVSDSNREGVGNVKGAALITPALGTKSGEPQWLAMKRGNARRAKDFALNSNAKTGESTLYKGR